MNDGPAFPRKAWKHPINTCSLPGPRTGGSFCTWWFIDRNKFGLDLLGILGGTQLELCHKVQ